MQKSYLFSLFILFFSCVNNGAYKSPLLGPEPDPDPVVPTLSTTISIKGEAQHKISPDLFGYNIVYAETPDEVWSDGLIKKFTRESNTSFIRYPGGTVVTYWHWKEPTGHGWDDSWDLSYNKPNKASDQFMDIDEYIALVKELGVNPLLGVNIHSGYKHDRTEDGIKDALDLMDYCVTKGIEVEYWYLGNEPYMHDANGGALTVEEYAALVNTYAVKMKQKNPSIKLIANWYSNIYQREKDYITLLKQAGENIDVIDAHFYWDFNTASWERWLQKTPIGQWTGQSFIDNIKKFRQITKENGYPNMQFASLEWNAGPGKEEDIKLNAAQNALIQSEMMLQFMMGGMDIATFWPLFWRSGQYTERGIYDAGKKVLNPNAMLLSELSKFSANSYFDTKISEHNSHIVPLFSEEPITKTLRGCVLNKNDEIIDLTVIRSGLSADDKYTLTEYYMSDNTSIVKENITANSRSKNSELNFHIKPYSIVFIEIQ